VVPVHNGADLVVRCLASVPEWAEVVVVDDASTDGAPELVERRFPRARLLRNERNRGFGATANAGLRVATGAVRVVLNSDARLRPGALEELAAVFEDPGVGIAGSRLVFPDGSHQTSANRFPTVGGLLAGSFALNELYRRLRPHGRFRWEMGLSAADHGADRDVDWVMGACIAIRDRCLEATGGFDESIFMYGEEIDLCWRARREGWRVRHASRSVVEHEGGGSHADVASTAPLVLRGEAAFFRRAYGSGTLRRWWWSRILGAGAKVLAFGFASPFDRRCRTRLRWQWAALRFLAGPGRDLVAPTEQARTDGPVAPAA